MPHTAEELLKNFDLVFQRIEVAGLNHSMDKCFFLVEIKFIS